MSSGPSGQRGNKWTALCGTGSTKKTIKHRRPKTAAILVHFIFFIQPTFYFFFQIYNVSKNLFIKLLCAIKWNIIR